MVPTTSAFHGLSVPAASKRASELRGCPSTAVKSPPTKTSLPTARTTEGTPPLTAGLHAVAAPVARSSEASPWRADPPSALKSPPIHTLVPLVVKTVTRDHGDGSHAFVTAVPLELTAPACRRATPPRV